MTIGKSSHATKSAEDVANSANAALDEAYAFVEAANLAVEAAKAAAKKAQMIPTNTTVVADVEPRVLRTNKQKQ